MGAFYVQQSQGVQMVGYAGPDTWMWLCGCTPSSVVCQIMRRQEREHRGTRVQHEMWVRLELWKRHRLWLWQAAVPMMLSFLLLCCLM